jgi:hypothetical protein
MCRACTKQAILDSFCHEGQTVFTPLMPLLTITDGMELLFGRCGMPGGGRKNLSDLALRELLRKRLLVGMKLAVAAAG